MPQPLYLQVGERRIGPGSLPTSLRSYPCNHLGSYERAEAILHAAHAAGADAIKLQTYTPDTMTLDCDGKSFVIPEGTPWAGRTEYDVYREAYTPWEWHPRLQRVARALGLDLFSTPYDATAVKFLEQLEVPLYKVSSFELVDITLLRALASTGKPMIISTGLATLEEISEAVQAVRTSAHVPVPIALLRCVSAYPAPAESNAFAQHLRTWLHASTSSPDFPTTP